MILARAPPMRHEERTSGRLMMNRMLSTAVVLAAAFAAPVFSQEVSPETYLDGEFCSANYSPESSGEQASGEAMDAQNNAEFAEMDLNDDGMVSQDEYIACRRAAAES